MKIEVQMQVAENIKYLRNVFGYTQTQVADGIHLCRSTVSYTHLGISFSTKTVLPLSLMAFASLST